jgi:hypothetical protein
VIDGIIYLSLAVVGAIELGAVLFVMYLWVKNEE